MRGRGYTYQYVCEIWIVLGHNDLCFQVVIFTILICYSPVGSFTCYNITFYWSLGSLFLFCMVVVGVSWVTVSSSCPSWSLEVRLVLCKVEIWSWPQCDCQSILDKLVLILEVIRSMWGGSSRKAVDVVQVGFSWPLTTPHWGGSSYIKGGSILLQEGLFQPLAVSPSQLVYQTESRVVDLISRTWIAGIYLGCF